jgi:hypothetical protein
LAVINLQITALEAGMSLLEYVRMILSCEFMYGFFNELGLGEIFQKICF